MIQRFYLPLSAGSWNGQVWAAAKFSSFSPPSHPVSAISSLPQNPLKIPSLRCKEDTSAASAIFSSFFFFSNFFLKTAALFKGASIANIRAIRVTKLEGEGAEADESAFFSVEGSSRAGGIQQLGASTCKFQP